MSSSVIQMVASFVLFSYRHNGGEYVDIPQSGVENDKTIKRMFNTFQLLDVCVKR